MGGRICASPRDARNPSTLEQVLPSFAGTSAFQVLKQQLIGHRSDKVSARQEEPVTCEECPHEAALDGQLLQLAWVGIWPQLPDEWRQQLESLQQTLSCPEPAADCVRMRLH